MRSRDYQQSNTHRAVIERHDHPITLIARGNRHHCIDTLRNFLEHNPLRWDQSAYVLKVEAFTHGPKPPMVVFGKEVEQP